MKMFWKSRAERIRSDLSQNEWEMCLYYIHYRLIHVTHERFVMGAWIAQKGVMLW